MPTQFDPPSGTRDFLAADVEKRERAFEVIRSVFSSYGYEPLQTPAFERLEVLLGKYGDDNDKLVFKILRRGEHEASGEADLALRYDHTVPLARVAAAYGSQLPSPYKRYALGPVWRADRPGKDRYREFVQCDLDCLGSTSILADAEAVCAQHDALAEVGIAEFSIQLNSRQVLAGLLEAAGVPPDLGPGVLITLDKLDKLPPGDVATELEVLRGLAAEKAAELAGMMTAPDAEERIRAALEPSEEGAAGLAEVDDLLALVTPEMPAGRIAFTPRLVRGLSYYTGPIWEVVARGVAGSIGSGGRYDHLIEQLGGPDVPATGSSLGIERLLSLLTGGEAARRGRLDVAVTVMSEQLARTSFALAATARAAGLRASVYLGRSRKLGRQLSWANDQGARWCLIYGSAEQEAGIVTVRDMLEEQQAEVPAAEVGDYLAHAAGTAGR
jgi:histidyl-tRNA synthetase